MTLREQAAGVGRDVAYAWRGLRRQPGFTAAAVLTVALCVGANTAIFGVVNAVLLQPLPYAHPERLVQVWNHWTNWPQTWLSQPEAYDYAARREAFASFGAYTEGAANLTGDGEPERVHVGLVTQSFLPTVGVVPVLGRGFTAEEDRPHGPEAALLDYGLWQRRYAGDRGILGRRIDVNGVPTTVVGVLPPGFRLPDEFAGEHSAVYRPLRLGPKDDTQRGGHYLLAVARLAPGVSAASAAARLGDYIEQYKRQNPGRYGPDFGASLVSIPDQILGSARRVLLLLLAAVGFVLLIGCANVASLLLSRAESRQREIAVRAALGAGRARLARQFLAESLLLGVLGAALALPLAAWGGAVLARIGAHDLPRGGATSMDARTLAFTLAAAIAASVVFGLAPAIHALRGDLHSSLRSGRGNAGDRRGARLRLAIVTAQIVLAVVSVAGAALMTRSFAALVAVPAGFRPDHVLTLRTSLPAARYPRLGAVRQFYSDLLMRVRALPGVRAAGAINALPLASTIGDWGVHIAGRPEPQHRTTGNGIAFDWQVVTPGYFQAMGIPLVRGRGFTDADTRDALPVVIVSEATVRKYWPDGDAIGARMRLGGSSDSLWRTVVGVAADVHHEGLEKAVRTEMYLPHAQFPSTDEESASGALTGMTLVVRTAGDPSALAGSVRRVIRDMDAQLPVAQVRPLTEVVEESVSTPRFATLLLGAFGILALVLSAVGVYGVMAYSVARRTGEIGIRMALGARAGDVLRLTVGQGMRPALLGLLIGTGAALACARFMRGLVFGVRATDAVSIGIAVLVLGGVALAATTFAARRVTRVDPSVALRAE